MLNKSERAVMDVIILKCKSTGCCLISCEELSSFVHQQRMNTKKVESVLRSLSLDGYFDLVPCKKSGEDLFCINLKPKGYSYKREMEQEKREAFKKIFFAVCSAVLTYLVGRVLFLIFK